MHEADKKQIELLLLHCRIHDKKIVSRGECSECGELLQRWDRKGICNKCYHIKHIKKGATYYTDKINKIQGVNYV